MYGSEVSLSPLSWVCLDWLLLVPTSFFWYFLFPGFFRYAYFRVPPTRIPLSLSIDPIALTQCYQYLSSHPGQNWGSLPYHSPDLSWFAHHLSGCIPALQRPFTNTSYLSSSRSPFFPLLLISEQHLPPLQVFVQTCV